MPKASDLKKGAFVEINGAPYVVKKVEAKSPSSRGAATLYKIRFNNLQSGQKLDESLKGDDFLKEIDCIKRAVQYSYIDGDNYIFMDLEDYTQYALNHEDIADQIGDTQILGISPDAPSAQAKWDTKHGLGFPLLSDPDHAVADKYGVWGPKKLYGKEYEGIIRSAFLIGSNGKIAHAWYKISPKATPEALLAALEAA